MKNICVFAGTTEGRRLVEFLSSKDARVFACVATDYGEALLEGLKNIETSAKRMDSDEMTELLESERFDLVIDATHPYASIVTENIRLACSRTCTEYLRLERESAEDCGEQSFSSVDDAVSYLNGTEGSIFLTTGSKELTAFSKLEGFSERCFARVLPMEDSLLLCREAGLAPSHIIAMQGPFSVDMNAATIKAVNASFVVTKQSGKAGGFEEKAQAARMAGAKLIVIGRPEESVSGFSYSAALKELEKRFGFSSRPKAAVIGIGMGGAGLTLTLEAEEAIRSAECIIGAKRMLESAHKHQSVFEAVSPERIAAFIREHGEYSRFAVLMSGDTGFFSGTKKLLPLLDFCDVTVLSGISSLSYLCARANLSYENVKTVSLHGREASIVPICERSRRVFSLVGGENGAGRLIDMLADAGLDNLRITVGEKLGHSDERINTGSAAELKGRIFDRLSAVYIENPLPRSSAFGLPDTVFIRNDEKNAVVPMTKSEVRAVCLSKLRLLSDSVVWDVGSGTGSVSVEAALTAIDGTVYAIEKKPEAAELTRLNAEMARLTNVVSVLGSAPEACADLPSPTHAFIGGSSGNMREIIQLVLSKNQNARIVATAISLETVSELNSCLTEFGFIEREVVCLNVSKARRIGGYDLMTAQNPVYIFTMQGVREEE